MLDDVSVKQYAAAYNTTAEHARYKHLAYS